MMCYTSLCRWQPSYPAPPHHELRHSAQDQIVDWYTWILECVIIICASIFFCVILHLARVWTLQLCILFCVLIILTIIFYLWFYIPLPLLSFIFMFCTLQGFILPLSRLHFFLRGVFGVCICLSLLWVPSIEPLGAIDTSSRRGDTFVPSVCLCLPFAAGITNRCGDGSQVHLTCVNWLYQVLHIDLRITNTTKMITCHDSRKVNIYKNSESCKTQKYLCMIDVAIKYKRKYEWTHAQLSRYRLNKHMQLKDGSRIQLEITLEFQFDFKMNMKNAWNCEAFSRWAWNMVEISRWFRSAI